MSCITHPFTMRCRGVASISHPEALQPKIKRDFPPIYFENSLTNHQVSKKWIAFRKREVEDQEEGMDCRTFFFFPGCRGITSKRSLSKPMKKGGMFSQILRTKPTNAVRSSPPSPRHNLFSGILRKQKVAGRAKRKNEKILFSSIIRKI